MSTLAALSAQRLVHRANRRRDLRSWENYVLLLPIIVGVAWAVQHYLGLGAVVAAERPHAATTGTGLVVALVLAVGLAGLFGPVLVVQRYEAQWLVTVPAGAAAMIAARMARSLVVAACELALLTLAAQALDHQRLDVPAACLLGVWVAGFAAAMGSLRYGFASYLERHDRPHLRRLLGCGLIGGAGFLVIQLPPVVALLGAPGATVDGRALASALAWLLIAVALVGAALRDADGLVARAVEAGGPGGRAAARLERRARRPSREPDHLVLIGARTRVWQVLMTDRRNRGRVAVGMLVFNGAPLLVALLAPRWTVESIAGVTAVLLLGATGRNRDVPIGSNGLLLPADYGRQFCWQLPVGTYINGRALLGAALVAALSEHPHLAVSGPVCLLPLAVLATCLGLNARDVDLGTAIQVVRRLRLLALGVCALAVGAGSLGSPLVGALLAALVLLLAAWALFVAALRTAVRTSGPVRSTGSAGWAAAVSGTR